MTQALAMPPDSLGAALNPSYPMHTAGCCLESYRLKACQLHPADEYHAVPKPTTLIAQVVSTVVARICPSGSMLISLSAILHIVTDGIWGSVTS